MPTYITLWDYTQSGIENIEGSPARLDRAVEVMESVGGELHDFYLTMGNTTSSRSRSSRTTTRPRRRCSASGSPVRSAPRR
jgi:hypothetical protein